MSARAFCVGILKSEGELCVSKSGKKSFSCSPPCSALCLPCCCKPSNVCFCFSFDSTRRAMQTTIRIFVCNCICRRHTNMFPKENTNILNHLEHRTDHTEKKQKDVPQVKNWRSGVCMRFPILGMNVFSCYCKTSTFRLFYLSTRRFGRCRKP